MIPFKLDQRQVTGIRFSREHGAVNRSDRRVKLFGMALKETDIKDFGGRDAAVKTGFGTEVGYSALGRHTGSGENCDPLGVSQKFGEPLQLALIRRHFSSLLQHRKTKRCA